MKLIRFEARKKGSKIWKGIFVEYGGICNNYRKYLELGQKLKGARNYADPVPKEWRFYFTEKGIEFHNELIQLMMETYKKYNYEVRTVEVRNTEKLKKRNYKILDQHQAVIY